MRTLTIILLVVFPAFVATASFAGTGAKGKGKAVIHSFDLKNVTLDGDLRRQFEEVRDYYLSIPNDDLLKPYRKRAGLPAPGEDLGGVYVSHSPLPQIISGLSRMYAATGDMRCRNKAVALADGWAKCMTHDGFFFAQANPEIDHYYYDKWVGGLVDLYVYADYPGAKEYLSKITGWAEQNLSRVRQYANPLTKDGGEWYTLTENLLRAYNATGDARYRDFARVWEYADFWKLFAEGKNIHENLPKPTNYNPWYHAYSHVNSLNGLGAAYLDNGDLWYLDTLKKAWATIVKEDVLVTGGYGQDECLVPLEEQIRRLGGTHLSFETQCGCWAAFKMSGYLTTLTGESKYGDWAELLVINGIGASIPMSSKGEVFYYSDYNTHGGEKGLSVGWPCCSGTRPEAVTEYHNLIYYKDDGALYVNLYTASSVNWRKDGQTITVRQVTEFPESEKVSISVECKNKAAFALRLRIPGWLTSPMQAKINEKSMEIKKDAKGWAVFEREWSGGDKLTITLPMGFRVSRPDPMREYPAAVAYGPVTLAARYHKGNPARVIDLKSVAKDFESVPGDALNWRCKSNPDLLLRPFYRYKAGERYFVYVDPSVDVPVSLSYTDSNHGGGEWSDFGGWMTSAEPGAWADVKVQGDSARVRGYLYDDAGRLEVIVDGKKVGTIDEYGPKRGEAASWEFRGFGPGEHKLRLEHTQDKNPESKGHFVNVAGFDYGF